MERTQSLSSQARADRLLEEATEKMSAGALEQHARLLGEALQIFRELGDQRAQFKTLLKLASAARNGADYQAALDYLREADALAATIGDPALEHELQSELCVVYISLNDLDAAFDAANVQLRFVAGGNDPEQNLLALNALGCIQVLRGQHAEGVARINESLSFLGAIAKESRRSYLHVQSIADLAEAHLSWGRNEEALGYAQQAEAGARRIGFQPLVMLASMYAGQAALRLGKPEAAVEKLRACIDLARESRHKAQQHQAMCDLGSALAELGRHAEAFETYRDGHRLEKEIHIDHAARRMEFDRARKEIERSRHEKESAERVLFSVLPQAIATRMTRGEGRIAEELADVSVLFADIVGFTALSTRTTPADLLVLLEEIFSEFDRLTGQFQLEKVKTIGDAYMAVGGALAPLPGHAENAVRLGLAMIAAIDTIRMAKGMPLAIRIGLHAGPVVAGVIGENRLAYDLWGESVNLASRLESSGAPGRIHVSAAVAERLRGTFDFEQRGTIELKGFGPVPTFFVS
jgi:class 3 adenylate cyclase